jgi:hypothetical protein
LEIERSSVSIRRMIGLLLMKHIYNLIDETIVEKWIKNLYWERKCRNIIIKICSTIWQRDSKKRNID